jgi:mRNA interferase MazF
MVTGPVDRFDFDGKDGQVVLDQLRSVEKTRLARRLGRIADDVQEAALTTLAEMFAP